MSAKRKRGTLEDNAFLVVCPEGVAHLADRETGEVQWSTDTEGLLWIAAHDKEVKDYADLREPQSGEYKMRLIHHTEEGKKKLVPCDTVALIKGYFQDYYSDDATDAFRKPKMFEVEYQTGASKPSFDPEIEENFNVLPQSMLLKRIDYYVHRASPLWSARFAKIEASFPMTLLDEDGETEGERRKCTVYHTATHRDFVEFCVKNSIHGFKRSSPVYALIDENFHLHMQKNMDEQKIKNLEEQLCDKIDLIKKNKKVTFQTPPLEEDGISFYKGEYDGNRAAIEFITDVEDIQTTVENLWMVNYHPNLRLFYGWELFASNKYALAYEEVELSLSVYVSMNPYKEMSHQSLTIIRGLASAVAHLHDRGFYHGNLNPDNIFVQKGTLKIGDLRSTKKIKTPTDGYSDLHAMAHIMLFIMSNGSHAVRQPLSPVTETDIDQLNIRGTNKEMYDLFERLGVLLPYSSATSRLCSPPQIQEEHLLKHLAFRPSADRMRFIRELADYINDGEASLHKTQMEIDINNLIVVPGSNSTTSDWAAILGGEIVETMRKLPNKSTPQSPYRANLPNLSGTTVVFELIKLMRNAVSHVNSFSERLTRSGTILADLLGRDLSELEVNFRTKFPSIFVLAYNVVERYKMEALPKMLLDYF